jgi:hypothetical protein
MVIKVNTQTEKKDGRTVNSKTGQRNRGQITRMSIDLTREEQKTFLMQAIDHNMTLRGFFYHIWKFYEAKAAEGETDDFSWNAVAEDEPLTGSQVAKNAVSEAKKRRATSA